MSQFPLNILILEDSDYDAEIIQRLLIKEFTSPVFKVVTNRSDFIDALDHFNADIILSDNSMPQFSASEALKMFNDRHLHIPFILVTGTVSETFAVEIIKSGADDYILKDRLVRLPSSIESSLKHRRAEKEKEEASIKLKQSEESYRTIMQRLSDGFIAADKNFNYTYVNKTAGEILKRAPGELIGKYIWDEFPEAVDHTFYKAYHKAMLEQQYIYVQAYSFPLQIWLENHIYPSTDGLSIFFRNITERKKSEEAIRQSEIKYRTMIERISDGFFSMDLEWRVTYINTVAEQLLERPPGYLLDKKMTEEFPQGIGRGFYNGYVQSLQTGANVQLEEYSIALNKWIRAGIFPSSTGVSIYFRDITKEREAEKQKEFDNNNLHALINNTKDLMWSVDRNYKLITSNKSFDDLIKSMTGETLLKGNNIFIKEFDSKQAKRYKDYYERAFAGEAFTEIEHDGTVEDFWSEISFYPIYEGTKVIGTACFSRNITDRIKAETETRLSNERYEAVAKATSDGIWDYDFITNKTYIAGTGYKFLFGYNIVNDYTKKQFWETRIHPDDRDRILTELDYVISNKKITQSASEYRFLKADGSYAYINDRFFIIRKHGIPIRMLGAKQDITVMKLAEQELKKSLTEKRRWPKECRLS